MSIRARVLGIADTTLHWLLDGYIDSQRPGWGRLQLWQWYVCNAYEHAADGRPACRRWVGD